MLGEILGTADLTGQMADRTWLEKLLLLFHCVKHCSETIHVALAKDVRQTDGLFCF